MIALVGGVAGVACLWLLFTRAQKEGVTPRAAPLKVGLPSECQLRVEVDLRTLMSQSGAATNVGDKLALSGLLGGASRRGHSAEDLASLTRNGKLQDIRSLKACQLKTGRTFVGILSGDVRPGALREAVKRAPDKWRMTIVAGAERA